MPFDHFGLIAGFYDRAGEARLSEPLLGLLSLSASDLILDAGGGTGRIAAAMRGIAGETFVADVSRGMLLRAAHKGLGTVCAPVEMLPFLSGSFNRVIMVDALHHVKDQRQTALETWRVLIPGGRIVIVEPDIRKFPVKLIALGERMLLMRSHFLNAEKMRALFDGMDAKIGIFYDAINVLMVVEKVREM